MIIYCGLILLYLGGMIFEIHKCLSEVSCNQNNFIWVYIVLLLTVIYGIFYSRAKQYE